MKKSELVAAYRLSGESRKRAIERIAALLRLNPAAVYQWPERMVGPRLFAVQCQIEVLSRGRLKADPDDNVSNAEARAIRDSDVSQSPEQDAEGDSDSVSANAA